MAKTNEIVVARAAIRKALASGEICREISGMHRVGVDAIEGACANAALVYSLAEIAARDILLGRK